MRNFIMGAMGMMGTMGMMGVMVMMSKRTEGQQHCCWESLRDYSFVKLKLQPSQTELLFRSVDDCFFWGQQHCCCMADCFFAIRAVAARWGYKQRKRSASWTDADLSC